MASASLRFVGLDELRDALKALPGDLTTDAAQVIDTGALDAERAIADAYPMRTGRLRGGVSIRHLSTGPGIVRTQIRSDAPYAAAYEKGSALRQTAKGYNRGRVSAHHVAVPILIQIRSRIGNALIALVERAGLVVRG